MKKFDKLSNIKNVGDKTLEKLNRLGLFTVQDLITHFPRDYEDRTEIFKLSDLINDEVCSFQAKIASAPQNVVYNKKTLTKVIVWDGEDYAEITWFNQPYLKKQLKPGDEYVFVGKVKKSFGKIQITAPKYEKVKQTGQIIAGRIVPKYPLTYGISQNLLQRIIKSCLEHLGNKLIDNIPKNIKDKYKLEDYNYAINNIHFPKSDEAYIKAKKRLIFEEFLNTQLALMYLKNKTKTDEKGIKFDNVFELSDFIKELPFELTNAQKRVVKEILSDMYSHNIMNRLVQGDVGSGKTVVALIALFVAAKNQYQGALMAPTEILAVQHFDFIKQYMQKHDIKVELLVGSISKKQKEEIYEKIKNKEVDIVIGTHALIQSGVDFGKLGLVITDEQHRFGVEQRMNLSNKGQKPDVMVMTATPIPRTLGLILYGDLDISIIDELPAGRKKIDTHIVNSSYYERMYGFVKEQIKEGRQAYVICPMVDENEENSELKSVVEYTENLKTGELEGYNVEYIHGKMKAKEKNDIMTRFKEGQIDVLVSTTVIEVGISVSNATIMIIENAERFGLAQLHQLRGRVGRGEHKSYCILVIDSKSKVAKERMDVMKNTNNGFIIAEKDMELRGVGQFFGTKQHGIPEFKIANLYEHTNILKEAQEAVREILDNDPTLQDEKHKYLKQEVDKILEYEVL